MIDASRRSRPGSRARRGRSRSLSRHDRRAGRVAPRGQGGATAAKRTAERLTALRPHRRDRRAGNRRRRVSMLDICVTSASRSACRAGLGDLTRWAPRPAQRGPRAGCGRDLRRDPRRRPATTSRPLARRSSRSTRDGSSRAPDPRPSRMLAEVIPDAVVTDAACPRCPRRPWTASCASARCGPGRSSRSRATTAQRATPASASRAPAPRQARARSREVVAVLDAPVTETAPASARSPMDRIQIPNGSRRTRWPSGPSSPRCSSSPCTPPGEWIAVGGRSRDVQGCDPSPARRGLDPAKALSALAQIVTGRACARGAIADDRPVAVEGPRVHRPKGGA